MAKATSKALLHAVRNNDIGECERILSLKGKAQIINDLDEHGDSALGVASRMNLKELTAILLRNDASPNVGHNRGWLPLHYAARNGNLEICEEILRYRVQVDAPNGDGAAALHIAAAGGFIEIMKLLLRHGADIELGDVDKRTPIFYCAKSGQYEAAKFLIERRATVDEPDEKGVTPSMLAAAGGYLEIIQLFIENGAIITFRDKSGKRPFEHAIRNRRISIARFLLERGAGDEAELKDEKDNQEPADVFKAAAEGDAVSLKKIIAKHSELLNAVDENGDTPLSLASKGGHLKAVQFLLENRASTDLIRAVTNLAHHIVFFLIFIHQEQWSALHYASNNDHVEVARELLKYGTSPDLANASGATSLHFASYRGNVKIVELLLEFKANPDAKEKIDGRRPIHMGIKKNHLEVVKVLVAAKADLSATANDGWNSTHFAAETGNVDILKVLLQNGAPADTPDQNGLTPLIYSSYYGQMSCCKALVLAGASLAVQADGKTAAEWAIEAGHELVANFLFDVESLTQGGRLILPVPAAFSQS
eukprot:TRINITY_DN14657_c0_g1_i6.p1 TRINITY_DN14657_c0_g1~~TRINITY_DN14657_c0_g1_i6.p1  ORF type:complete len:536 (+),score=142.92 TRINITY_DN14657_c0_g1_i6:23-1630(+)